MSEGLLKEYRAHVAKTFEKNVERLAGTDRAIAAPGQDFCEVQHDGFTCTKAKGHEDKLHVAHSTLGYINYKWED